MALSSKQVSTTEFQDGRRMQSRIQVRIPKHFHKKPVISRLVSQWGVTVNITAAQLGDRIPQEGCFELEIRGTAYQIESALSYLDQLNVEIWHQSTTEEDGW